MTISNASNNHYMTPTILQNLGPYPQFCPGGLPLAHPGVAAILKEAGLNPANPLARWIRPGMTVLIKPNWVRHAAEGWSHMESLITHPSIIRPIVEFAANALRMPDGRYQGQIVLADAPLQSANLELLLEQSGMPALLALWQEQELPLKLVDLRRFIADSDDNTAVVLNSRSAPGDPLGDTIVDLGTKSRLDSLLHSGGRVGVSNYDSTTTTAHHQPGRHQYRIANSLLHADVVLNLPKWKTHVKTGVTGALKNFIGINCDKAYLPHFRVGSPRQGGDEYPDSWNGGALAKLRPILERFLPANALDLTRRILLAVSRRNESPYVFGGAWPGNDTLWRTVHDMVFIARWLGPQGEVRRQPRPILSLLDAVVAGQGDGPLRPEACPMGALLFGTDPGLIDVHAAALSGFNWQSIELLAHLCDPEAREITSFEPKLPLPPALGRLKPPAAWRQRLCPPQDQTEGPSKISTPAKQSSHAKEKTVEAA